MKKITIIEKLICLKGWASTCFYDYSKIYSELKKRSGEIISQNVERIYLDKAYQWYSISPTILSGKYLTGQRLLGLMQINWIVLQVFLQKQKKS